MAANWTKDSWRGKPILQVPDYTDQAKLEAAEAELRKPSCGIIHHWCLPVRRGI
jgi:3-deoxy-D-arabino-heptulosonate 7-phosphate (DAHP) synthase class II